MTSFQRGVEPTVTFAVLSLVLGVRATTPRSVRVRSQLDSVATKPGSVEWL